MAACPNCHRELPENVQDTCPACGANLAQLEALLSGSRPRVERPPMGKSAGGGLIGKIVGGVIALTIAGVVAYSLLKTEPFPQVALSPAPSNKISVDPCIGKSTCVVVYLAPWCGYCKLAVPTVKELAKRWADDPNRGIKAVVSSGKIQQNYVMALALSPEVHVSIDATRALSRELQNLGFKGVPHWYRLDEQGHIAADVAGFGASAALLDALGVE
jgi:thiol-disulfide isomerase/thioredoxin